VIDLEEIDQITVSVDILAHAALIGEAHPALCWWNETAQGVTSETEDGQGRNWGLRLPILVNINNETAALV
jgi:hypothetical protein